MKKVKLKNGVSVPAIGQGTCHIGDDPEMYGRQYDVLIQKRISPDFAQGLTPNYIPVRIYGSAAQRHDIVRVTIDDERNDVCTGMIQK